MSNIVFVDVTQDYPLKFTAGNSKAEFLGKGLYEEGNKITICNGQMGTHGVSRLQVMHNQFAKIFLFPRKKIVKNYLSLFGLLKHLKKSNEKNYIIYDFNIFYPFFIVVVIIAKILNYKLVIIFHEWHQSIRGNKLRKLLSKVFDLSFGYFSSAILPISAFLEEKAKRFKKPMLRVPVLSDFKSHQEDEQFTDCSYLLFCGHSRYIRLIKVLLSSIKELAGSGISPHLKLVLIGKEEDVLLVRKEIEKLDLSEQVTILSGLPFDELFVQYRNALALLLPLSENSLQDKARFSQKTAEYLSSKRPILTVNVGEISEYFTDQKDAFICDKLDSKELSKKLELLYRNKELCNEVGLNGYKLGLDKFDYRKNAKDLNNLLNNIS